MQNTNQICLCFPGIPTSSQPTMTVTAQRRQPPVVPLTLTSDLHLQQSPQQLSPTLSSPVNITQVRAKFRLVPKALRAQQNEWSAWLRCCVAGLFWININVLFRLNGWITLNKLIQYSIHSSFLVHLSSVCANRDIDPGAAAWSVPPVQPADASGPGPASQWPPEAAAGSATRHPAHHFASSHLYRYRHSQQPLCRQPDYRQHQHQLGKIQEMAMSKG